MENINLKWTIYPGCCEWHLRCRYQNLLFPEQRRQVSKAELEEAQQKDATENQQFKKQVYDLLPEMQTALSGKQTVNDLLGFHRRIYDLLERSGEIGGNLTEERKILTGLFVALDEDAKNSVAENNEAAESLKKLREHLHGGVQMQVNNFLAQMGRGNSPVLSEDVVPRFLTEDIETIKNALPSLKQSGVLETLRKGVTEIIASAIVNDTTRDVLKLEDKLKLIFAE